MFDKSLRLRGAFFIAAALLAWAISGPLKSVTVEVEEDEAEFSPTPIPKVDSKPGGAKASSHSVMGSAEKPMARVRISDKIGFYYFIKSGYVIAEESQVSSLGNVTGQFENNINYSTPKKTYIELSASAAAVKKGDRFVIYRVAETVSGSNSTQFGYWVRNLAVVKVLEAEKSRCLVEVTQSFYPFEVGDQVRAYGDELKRWKQARVKKELSAHSIECVIAGGDPSQKHFVAGECVVLAAGSKKGVVEGQDFELKLGKESGSFEPDLHLPMGKIRVFYTGPDFSMAQILFSQRGVETGFEAKYQP